VRNFYYSLSFLYDKLEQNFILEKLEKMIETANIYEKLMEHLTQMAMMCPTRSELLVMLKENITQEEAKILLAIPSDVIPFEGVTAEKIANTLNMPEVELNDHLIRLTKKGLLFSNKNKACQEEYALQQVGYGFPQTFFWKGEDTPHSRKMASHVLKYFNTEVTREVYCTDPLPYRFVPVDEVIEPEKAAILPYQVMKKIIENAKVICVAHCICRITTKLKGKGCEHPTEVCMKFDDLARYMIDKNFGREITKKEALEISKMAESEGLVHFTDNSIENVQQNCNCCGCSCWNLGRIKRRMLPRDEIIATYFIRETIEENCTGCGNCIEICPVDAITIKKDKASIDLNWCVGCGLCVSKCLNDAIKIVYRKDLKYDLPEPSFQCLHKNILKTRK